MKAITLNTHSWMEEEPRKIMANRGLFSYSGGGMLLPYKRSIN